MQPPATPPTHYAPPPAPRQKSRWPAVIGIIALVLGLLAVMGGCFGIFSVTIFTDIMAGAAPPQQSATFDAIADHRPTIIVMTAVGMLLGAVLTAGGAGLWKRKRWGVRVCVGWAVAQIVFTPINLALQWPMTQDQLEATRAQAPPVGGSFYETITYLSMGVGLLFSLALPAFMLVWFARPKIRAEVREFEG